MPAAIELIQVSKEFSEASQGGLKPLSLTVEEGDFITVLGTSGSGKTTLLKLINRLIEPSGGQIFIHGQDTSSIPVTALRKQIGYVIQQAGLFQHMTVGQNIATVPEILGWHKAKTAERVERLLELVELDPKEYKDRYPRQLSGGQQQRVGIARALAGDPAILLMDEPLGAVDALTRTKLQAELLSIQQKLKKTVIFVTHDIQEALKLGDKVIVMKDGEVQQYGTPCELQEYPANEFVQSLMASGETANGTSVKPAKQIRMNEAQPLSDALEFLRKDASNTVAIENRDSDIIGTISLCGAGIT